MEHLARQLSVWSPEFPWVLVGLPLEAKAKWGQWEIALQAAERCRQPQRFPLSILPNASARRVNHVFDFNDQDELVATIDGALWFLAVDVSKALGIANISRATFNLGEDVFIRRNVTGKRGKPPKLVYESAVYALIMRPNKPPALAFQDWVTGVVLPGIRKDGGYVMGE
ncbi:Bro-N domain-containing protein [Primorskyibacter sp. 2E107]|uniref:BRO-N domain-containing protein n=1 Tax=Primorskyibacter sp. 2E107 TaxID=3403458 RepID=UPI003AF80F51